MDMLVIVASGCLGAFVGMLVVVSADLIFPTVKEFKFLKCKRVKQPEDGFELEYIEKNDVVGAMILSNNMDKCYMVNQFRAGVQDYMYEIVAGNIDDNEDPLKAVLREVKEESGFTRKDFELIYMPNSSPLVVSAGYTTERMYLYVFILKEGVCGSNKLSLDKTEHLTGRWVDTKDIPDITDDMKTHFLYNEITI